MLELGEKGRVTKDNSWSRDHSSQAEDPVRLAGQLRLGASL